MDEIRFKSIDEADLPAVLEIYNHYLLTTTATFRLQAIPIETLRSFIFLNHDRYKAYLIHHQDQVAGFCFLTRYKDLQAYDRTAEIGIYLKPGFTRRGLGAAAVAHLEQVAAASGLKMLIASISGENAPPL